MKQTDIFATAGFGTSPVNNGLAQVYVLLLSLIIAQSINLVKISISIGKYDYVCSVV
jgi:hypothetical protein